MFPTRLEIVKLPLSCLHGRWLREARSLMLGNGWRQGVRVFCLHCGESFLAESVKVDASDHLLVCPTAGCEGSPMDWSTEPWEVLSQESASSEGV